MMRRALCCCLLLSSCVGPLTPPDGARLSCGDDGDCPAPLRCGEAGLCVDPASGCVSIIDERARVAEDGAPCTEVDVIGHCLSGACVADRCGDGFVGRDEACDDGAANSDVVTDACRSDCTRARCGDGVTDSGESCDEDSETCVDCLALCSVGTASCDDEPGCECSPDVISAGQSERFTAVAADGLALWLAVYDELTQAETRLVRYPHSGEAPTTVATFDGHVSQLLVADGELLVRESTAPLADELRRIISGGLDGFFLPESLWSRLSLDGGSAPGPLVRSYGGVALRGGELAYVAADEEGVRALFRGPRDDVASHQRVGTVECRVGSVTRSTAGCELAFRGDDVIVRDDQGALLIAPPGGGLEVFVDVAAAETLVVVEDDVYWTSAGEVVRKGRAGVVEGIAQLPPTRGLVVAPPFAFVAVPGFGRADVVSIHLESGALLGRGTGGGHFAADALGIYWLDILDGSGLTSSLAAVHLSVASSP